MSNINFKELSFLLQLFTNFLKSFLHFTQSFVFQHLTKPNQVVEPVPMLPGVMREGRWTRSRSVRSLMRGMLQSLKSGKTVRTGLPAMRLMAEVALIEYTFVVFSDSYIVLNKFEPLPKLSILQSFLFDFLSIDEVHH